MTSEYYKPCKELGIDLDAPVIDRETIRKNLQCKIERFTP